MKVRVCHRPHSCILQHIYMGCRLVPVFKYKKGVGSQASYLHITNYYTGYFQVPVFKYKKGVTGLIPAYNLLCLVHCFLVPVYKYKKKENKCNMSFIPDVKLQDNMDKHVGFGYCWN